MGLDKILLDALVCPETRAPLGLASDSLIDAVNSSIVQGKLTNRGGEAVRTRLEAGLVRADGLVLYPVYDGIPNLLVGAAIDLD